MKFLGIIPARYASTRFPAKPLAILGGKTVIQRVYEQVAGVLDDAYVATDDERIEAAVKAFGGKVVMTSVDHKSGTDRCYEACTKIGGDFDVVVNIQGDEPFIQPSQLNAVKICFEDPTTQIATLVKPFTADEPFAVLENVNSPKVVVNKNWNALYFSRSIIPYQRNTEKQDWLKGHTYYKHIGLYAYRTDVLKEITALPQSSLELAVSKPSAAHFCHFNAQHCRHRCEYQGRLVAHTAGAVLIRRYTVNGRQRKTVAAFCHCQCQCQRFRFIHALKINRH